MTSGTTKQNQWPSNEGGILVALMSGLIRLDEPLCLHHQVTAREHERENQGSSNESTIEHEKLHSVEHFGLIDPVLTFENSSVPGVSGSPQTRISWRSSDTPFVSRVRHGSLHA